MRALEVGLIDRVSGVLALCCAAALPLRHAARREGGQEGRAMAREGQGKTSLTQLQ